MRSTSKEWCEWCLVKSINQVGTESQMPAQRRQDFLEIEFEPILKLVSRSHMKTGF